MVKTYVFLDTESTVSNGSRVIYDLSITVVQQKENVQNIRQNVYEYEKQLRNRKIKSDSRALTDVYKQCIVIDEFSHLVPDYKKPLYGFSNYEYMPFADAVHELKVICDVMKPDAIMGYNLIADIEAIKSTEIVLGTSKCIYKRISNTNVPPYRLFYINKCVGYDKAIKSDLMVYLNNFCPNFMKEQEEFCIEHNLVTNNGYTSRTLQNMYRYAVNNPDIEQMHMGYYDNMYAIECLNHSIYTDGCMYLPFNGMNINKRKRININENKNDDEVKIFHKFAEIPEWFQDQLLNSKCSNIEDIDDIRKFHPDFGGPNKVTAPYFRGVNSREGIWPPSYSKFNN